VEHGDIHLYYRNKIANSFSDFIERYLKEGLIVYDASPVVQIGNKSILGPSDQWTAIRNDGLHPQMGEQYLLEFNKATGFPFANLMHDKLESPLLTWLPLEVPPAMNDARQKSILVLNRLGELEQDYPYERKGSPVIIECTSCQLAGRSGWKFLVFLPEPVSPDFDEKAYGFRARKYRRYYCLDFNPGVLVLMDELTVGEEPTINGPLSDPMRNIFEALRL